MLKKKPQQLLYAEKLLYFVTSDAQTGHDRFLHTTSMKALLIFFLFPLQLPAQDITGIWTGYIQTTETQLPYELVISEDKGGLSGYSLTIFTFNGVENIGIKSMKFKNKNGKISVEDDALIYNNFSSPSRKVKLLAQLSLTTEDSVWILSGSFFTRSLDFRAENTNLFNGTILLKKHHRYQPTKLISKLDEMNLLTSLSFTVPSSKKKEEPAVVTAPVEEIELPKQKERVQQVDVRKATAAKASLQFLQPKLREVPPVSIIYTAEPEPMPEPKIPARSMAVVQKKIPERTIKAIAGPGRKNIVVTPPPVIAATPLNETSPTPVDKIAAAQLAERKTEIIRSVPFSSDSLVLSLYDNGTIDGDTVSVVLNGKVIIAKKGLTANAIRTTIHITPELGDSLQLIMYAENLGSIPPNTGLLIIQDGGVRNEIRFAGDMQKSSAIILKRKR